MSERQPTRAELIARITASSKDAVVLAEMQRLGFWPAGSGQPGLEAGLIQREAELMQVLQGLQRQLHDREDPQAALKAMRKERMAQALQRREANAQAREKQRHERALRWHETRHRQLNYLGHGVSGGLGQTGGDPARLAARGLPGFDTPGALAQAMGISPAELKFLCFHREVARISHYRRFALPKKTGGERIISAPMPRLKRAQYWVLDQILAKVGCHAAAHGFVPGRSILSNAAPHCGQAVLVNIDLKDFFPSVTYPRIKGVFAGLGYSEALATVLALLCSENASDELEVDGEHYFVGGKAGERVLPQGAPTSPMLTNLLCRQLDRRLSGAARKLGFVYTRYADDMSFSASAATLAAGDRDALCGRLLRQVHFIVRDEGFTPHPDKQQVMRCGARQEVTGIVVNHTPSVPRRQRRALRAALHRARTQGLQAVTWQGQPATPSVLLGYAQFVQMVHARQGTALLAQARALAQGTPPAAPAIDVFRQHAARGEAPPRRQGPWWQAAERPAPQLLLTAGQIKTARQERLRAARQAGVAGAAARSPSSPAAAPRDQAGPGSGDTSTPPSAPVPWYRLGVQTLLLMSIASRIDSPLMLVLASCWMGFALYTRRLGWPLFVAALLVMLWLSNLAR